MCRAYFIAFESIQNTTFELGDVMTFNSHLIHITHSISSFAIFHDCGYSSSFTDCILLSRWYATSAAIDDADPYGARSLAAADVWAVMLLHRSCITLMLSFSTSPLIPIPTSILAFMALYLPSDDENDNRLKKNRPCTNILRRLG